MLINEAVKVTGLTKKAIEYYIEQAKRALLDKLGCGNSYDEISMELKAIESNTTITEKLIEAFPGFYGRFVCLHFARFLDEPIVTEEQQRAYQEIISFLDGVPTFNIPEDLQELLIEGTKHISTQNITEILEKQSQSYQNPDKFLADNKEILGE